MKSGAGDDPFAEDQSEGTTETPSDEEASGPASATDSGTSTQGEARTQARTLPYKYRRNSVKQDRNQQPVFLQSSTEELIEETIGRVEGRFDEDVYKTDVVEAMLVAGGEGTTPEAVLQRWGYGMKNG